MKRINNRVKIYDTERLCAFSVFMFFSTQLNLKGNSTKDVDHGAVAGYYFENYVVGEMLRTFSYGKNPAFFSFYRDKDQREIDLIVEQDGILHPLEIKKSAEPDRRTLKVFTVLQKGGRDVGAGGIV